MEKIEERLGFDYNERFSRVITDRCVCFYVAVQIFLVYFLPSGNAAYRSDNNWWYFPNNVIASTSGNTECERITNLIKTTTDESHLAEMRVAKLIMCFVN